MRRLHYPIHLGDAYTLDYWTEMAKRVEDMGADSLCIKDMAGLLVPYKATELVQALKEVARYPNRSSYTLYFRCGFHDIFEGS